MSVMGDFKPSSASLTPKQQVLKNLKYCKLAVGELEKQIRASDEDYLPGWALTRINQAATCLGQAVSYINQTRQTRDDT